MSVYKVPQDVEADDKLLGPFNFRQFIYLMVAAGLLAMGFFLYQIFPGLIIIPAPFLIFFLVLALPLKKDQPMELYLAAVLSFYIKPNKRIWQADGIEHLIEISAPNKTDEILTKNIGRDEASRRLNYLADIVDTEGWAIKNAVSQQGNLQQDVFYESQQMSDIFENHRADRIDSMLTNHGNLRKQQIIKNMNTARDLADYTQANASQIQTQTFTSQNTTDLYNQSIERAQSTNQNEFLTWNSSSQQPQPINQPVQSSAYDFQNSNSDVNNIQLHYNPYPDSIRQSVISPSGKQPTQLQPASSQNPPNITQQEAKEKLNPEIARLVSEGKDLSIETLARQANKISKKYDEIDLNEDEVIISLR